MGIFAEVQARVSEAEKSGVMVFVLDGATRIVIEALHLAKDRFFVAKRVLDGPDRFQLAVAAIDDCCKEIAVERADWDDR